MASKALETLHNNATDIERLLELHEEKGGTTPGRKFGLEVLNKSGIVLITAFWEAFCEDLVDEALRHIIQFAPSANSLPVQFRKDIAAELQKHPHEMKIWELSGEGWRNYLSARADDLKRNRDFNWMSPKSKKVDKLFNEVVGLASLSSSWKWKPLTVARAKEKLDGFVSLRGDIAHRGAAASSVKKVQVQDYFAFVKGIAEKSDEAVNAYVVGITSKPLA